MLQTRQQSKKSKQPQRIDTPVGGVEALGDAALLEGKKLALICSRKCPGDVILMTYDFARLVRGSGIAVVSGFHSPIEKDCLPILLRGPGPIIICQGNRLSTSRLPTRWQKAIDAGHLLLISPFAEKQKRVTAELAAERNRFVCQIADEVLVPYAAPGSKTESLCREQISSGKRLYAFQNQANAALIEMGALPIEPNHFSPSNFRSA